MKSGLLLVVAFCASFGVGNTVTLHQAKQLPSRSAVTRHQSSEDAATCVLQIHNDTADSYFGSFAVGDRIGIYIDPSICAAPTYPFNVDGIFLTLFGGTGAVWPVHLAVEVWSATETGGCGGPKSLLYSESFSLDSADFQFPSVGAIPFSDSVCVSAPFYAVIEYIGGTAAPYPSILFDSDRPGDTCSNWGYAAGYGWFKWNGYWNAPIPGNCIVFVQGETASSLCNSSCCIGKTGNVDGIGIVDIVDLSSLVYYLTGSGYSLACPDAANVNGLGIIDIVDLSSLISYLTGGNFALPSCP